MKSYKQIFKTSVITGSAQLINYSIGMIRMKVIAVLLGTSGVGLIGLYNSIVALGVTLSQMGVDQSGIREIAEAEGRSDSREVASLIKAIQRICWVSGLLGWLLVILLAPILSSLFFQTNHHAILVVVLGAAILFGVVNGVYSAKLRGLRKILDLAKIQVLASLFSTLIAVSIFCIVGEKGIIPAIVLTAFMQLCFSWWFSKRIVLVACEQKWTETLKRSKRLLYVGSPFLYGALLAVLVAFLIRIQTVRELGIEANGIYQAVWAISGMLGGFIVTAMAADFYPRLTAASEDHTLVNSLVNEQIEIGTLLALPGLVMLTGFTSWVLRILYSASFLSGSELLPWFVLGAYGTILIFPLGMIQRAKVATAWMYVGQTEANLVHLILIAVFTSYFGLTGLGYAFSLHIIIHGVVVYLIAKKLSGFSFTGSSLKLIICTLFFMLISVIINHYANNIENVLFNGLLVIGVSLFSLKGLIKRLGADHRISLYVDKLPFLRRLVSGEK